MKEQLRRTPPQFCLPSWRMPIGLCILFLIVNVSAHSQPVMLSNISPTSKNFTYVNSRLYFSGTDSLFTASPTSAPTLVFKTGEPIIAIYNLTLNSNFFFVTQTGAGPQTLWRTNGTAGGTSQVTTNPQITPIITHESQLFMRVNDPVTGVELWKVDGTFSASLLKDINPGTAGGFKGSSAILNNEVYFFASEGTGTNLWKTNGTTAGTVLSVDLDDETETYNLYDFRQLTTVNSVMFFTRDYETYDYGERIGELWKTDGTSAGTSMVYQFTGGYFYNYLSNFTAHDGKLYFFHSIGDPAYHYFSVSDGTTAGTQHIDRTSIDGAPRQLIDAGVFVLYYAESQGFTTPIEKYDGTSVRTVHEFSLYHSTQDEYIDLTYTNDRAFFLDTDGEYYSGYSELWQADLLTGNTRSVADIHGFSLSNSGDIVAADGSVFFTRRINGQTNLWYYEPDAPPTQSCTGTGSIVREKWDNIPGDAIASIPATTADPSSTSTLTSFDAPQNNGDNFGARIRGYVCVPDDGNYVFYISGDANSELWLSTDNNPLNKRRIASSQPTNYQEWTKYPSQQSSEIPLVKGQKYYIEALHKESTGADHVSVGWKLPNGTLERPIPGMRLIQYDPGTPPTVVLVQPSDGAAYTEFANVDIDVDASDAGGTITDVSLYLNGSLLRGNVPSPYTYKIINLSAGTYTLEARATDNEGNIRSDSATFTVAPPSCTGTGGLYQEFWVNVTGSDVTTFNYATQPNGGKRYLANFETPQYYANNYASRMRGWICVPQTGEYTLWISSDDSSELYLSTDDSEANKTRIAWVYGSTQFRKFDKYASQKSAKINLQAGRKYYIEARHKEGNGNDFISVQWQLPDATLESPIPGNRLISIPSTPDAAPAITITSPTPNQNFTTPGSVHIAANVTDADGVRNVQFSASNGNTSYNLATFTSAPYEYVWQNPPAGNYTLHVYASDNQNTPSSKDLNFTVTAQACSGTGTIVREIWTGISGTSISSIPINSAPNKTVNLTSLSTTNYYGNDYGSRIRGYVCVPATGAYRFWISGDDNSELWLSNSDAPSGKTKIASVTGNTSINQWEKYTTQKSALINLVQGQRYYIEILHKEANGADHVEVGWQLPSGTLERPLGGNRIIPFEDPSTSATAFATEGLYDAEEPSGLSVYPNPVVSGSQFTLALDGETGEIQVDILSATGVSVQNEKLSSDGSGVVIDLKSSIAPGMYLIRASSNKKRWANKLQVK